MFASNRIAMRRLLPALGAVAVAAGGLTPAVASSSTPTYIVARQCQEQQAFVDGDAAAVAARLPARYTAERDPITNAPLLFFRAERCQVSFGGASVPATMASFGIVVKSPDGRGCASSAPVLGTAYGDLPPVCNWYTLRWLATSERVVDWLQTGTPGFPARFASALSFAIGAADPASEGTPFRFAAPSTTGSPFVMTAATRPRPGTISVRGGYWSDTAEGTVKLAFSTDAIRSGDATGTVWAPRGTEASALMGATVRPYLPGYSGISAEFFQQGVYRKQIYGPAPNTHQFAGSCSVQGTVAFTPPATNTPQALTYDYPATGTCTGRLDGRSISKLPVHVHQAGHSFGSCNAAHTTAPGAGSLTFDGSAVRIDYTFDFSSDATEVPFTFYGNRSGTADAHGTFLTPRTPPDVGLRCASSGAGSVPMDVTVQTETPLVS